MHSAAVRADMSKIEAKKLCVGFEKSYIMGG
jgi:hypothetical protein